MIPLMKIMILPYVCVHNEEKVLQFLYNVELSKSTLFDIGTDQSNLVKCQEKLLKDFEKKG